MNRHIVYPALSLGLLLVMTPLAVAQAPPLPAAVERLMQQCVQGYKQGEYRKVLPICQRAVETLQAGWPAHRFFADAVNNLGEVYRALGDFRQTEALLVRSLQIREKTLGGEHPAIAQSLNNLAAFYNEQGNALQAESLHLRSLRIQEKVLGPEHPSVALSLTNLAVVYYGQENYVQAEALYLRSLRIREKVLGGEHPEVVQSLHNLAELYRSQGNYPKAEPLLQRSLAIMEKVLGAEHPKLALGLAGLAALYADQGAYDKSEALLLRSLSLQEKALGPDHPDLAISLLNLAELYKRQGNFAKAELISLRGHQLWEKALGPEHPRVASSLNSLATLYDDQNNFEKAEPLYLRSLQIQEKVLGPAHTDVGISLNNLAALYRSRREYTKAEPMFRRSLEIFERALGSEHPRVASALNNLAGLYSAQGQVEKAESLYLRSLKIREKALGPEHPDVALSLSNLGSLDLERGFRLLALPRLLRALDIRERTLRATATEARVTALLNKLRDDEDLAYSLLLQKDAAAEERAFALRVSLLRKGRAAETGLMTGWALQASLSNPVQQQRFAQWQALRSQNEKLTLRGPVKQDDSSRQAHQAQRALLNNQIDDLEHELARAAPQLAQWKLPAPAEILGQVAARIPAGNALVEVLRFSPLQLQPRGRTQLRAPPRYVALILFPDQRTDFVDLGDAEEMDRAAGELLLAIRDLTQEPLLQAQLLYQKVMVPLLPKLSGVKRMYLSLDGSLNLVPFAALHDGTQYVIDAPLQILYLSSGRDLLQGELGQWQQPALVMADPDFQSHVPGLKSVDSGTPDVHARGLYEGLKSLEQLKGARAEGTLIGSLLHVAPLLGPAATEARLRQVRSPFILHVATHGLFLNSAQVDSRGARATMVGARPTDTFKALTGRSRDLSLSHSALVLAGAAKAATALDAADDGLLTGEEARSLSLFGTQLVVLSACDTGRGSVKAGQGVYGLRRAFLAAGAQTVVMSLWPVSDTSTQGLMQRYYRLLLDDKAPRGRISALTEAMQAVKRLHPHPYYWAPFIANGLDAPLHARPAVPAP